MLKILVLADKGLIVLLVNSSFFIYLELPQIDLIFCFVYLSLELFILLAQCSDVGIAIIKKRVNFSLVFENPLFQFIIFTTKFLKPLLCILYLLECLFQASLQLQFFFIFSTNSIAKSFDFLGSFHQLLITLINKLC